MQRRTAFRDAAAAFDPSWLSDAPGWQTVTEPTAARLLGLSPQQVRALRAAGQLGFVQLSARRIGYAVAGLRRFVESRTVPAAR